MMAAASAGIDRQLMQFLLQCWAFTSRLLPSLLLSAAILLPMSVTLSLASTEAQAQQGEAKKRKTRRVPTIREKVYKRLGKVQEMLDAKDPEGARDTIQEMLNRRESNAFERASMHNLLAYIAYTEEDYALAIDEYKKVIADPSAIPFGLELGTLYTLGQLYFVEENYPKAISYLEEWFAKVEEPSPGPYIFLAQVYYQLKNYDRSFEIAKLARRIAEERELSFREHWWVLLRTLHYQREEYDAVVEILEILVRDYPKREYWVQLSGMYGQQEKEERQKYTLDAAYLDDLLTKQGEILNLVGLLLQSEAPYRAAIILEKAIEAEIVERTSRNMELLAQAWQLSQETEKAIPAFLEAAKGSKVGKLHLYLAQLYLEREEYSGCEKASVEALRKGKLKQEGMAYEVQGMCRLNSEKVDKAKDSFEEAWRIAGESKNEQAIKRIGNWLRFLKQEEKRLRALNKL